MKSCLRHFTVHSLSVVLLAEERQKFGGFQSHRVRAFALVCCDLYRLSCLPHVTGQCISLSPCQAASVSHRQVHPRPRPPPSRPPYHSSAPHSVSQSHLNLSRSAAIELPWQQARVFHLFFFLRSLLFFLSFFLRLSLSLRLCLVTCIFKRISCNPLSKADAVVARGACFYVMGDRN